MRKTLVLFVMTALLVCMVQPAFAGQPLFEPVPSDKIDKYSQNDRWNKMSAITNPDNTFKQVEYYVKSTGATSGIRYRTKQITFAVGQYGPATFGADKLRSKVPGPGETIYDKVILDRGFFMSILGSASGPGGPQLVDQALDTEAYLYVGAIIELYNANTGQVLAVINSQDECQSKGSAQGFGASDIADMKSRWQQVPLREVQPPDFFPTPEGSTEWKPSYKDPNTCAKSYEGDPGQTINIPVTLHNSGAHAITDFSAVWFGYGNDPEGGWEKPIWSAGKVDIPSGGSQEFTVPVTVPQPDQENRLVFKANVNGQTPSSETNQENNVMIIRVGNPGVDLKVTINPSKKLYVTQQVSYVQPGVTIIVKRVDTGTNPVKATYTYKLPGQPAVTQTITVPPNGHYSKHYNYHVSQPGSFTTTASAYPIGLTDINPADNTASCIQQVQLTNNQQKTDSSPKTRVGLSG